MQNKNILSKIGKADLNEFAQLCHDLFKVNKELFINEVLLLYKWHNNSDVPEKIQLLQDKWYNSLKVNGLTTEYNYSVYDDPYYLADCWACWKVYSRNYLRSIINAKSIMDEISNVSKIIDVGCGIGYTTLAIQEIFNNATVYGTNIEGTKQWELCQNLGINLVEDVYKIGDADLIFATEYFEHFEDPVTHLKYLIKTCNPKYLIIASSFGTVSIGHFIEQVYNGKKVPAKGFGRIFNKELRKLGYQQQKTGIFNNKPSYWIRYGE